MACGDPITADQHPHGGHREANAVNRYILCHEVPNLGVLGASVMGTSAARNPALAARHDAADGGVFDEDRERGGGGLAGRIHSRFADLD